MASGEIEREHFPTHSASLKEASHSQQDMRALRVGHFLDQADTFIYAAVGVSLLLGATLALIYTFWMFGVQVFLTLPRTAFDTQPGIFAEALIEFVSGLLLVLIIVEVLGTVTHYIKAHETSLRPFLSIGIVSATRSILVISAKLAVVAKPLTGDQFRDAMIELGISCLLVLGLAITLRLLNKPGTSDLTG